MSNFKFSQEYVLYKAKKEGVYPIKETDWSRLKRQINGIIPDKNLFQILSSISFGVFASAIFSIIGFGTAEKLDVWVIPTSWVIFSVSLIAGIGLLILDRQQKEMITYSTNDVLSEMTEIEKTFDKSGDVLINGE
ncbi:MAG: hypothetical protein FGM16_07170 [Flavobacterium sp.]|jgi:hypothetical protein|nr:hypothetical protein [Flavobacterium sp.]